MCLDADGWFLRDFYIDEFMYDDETPYTALIEDNDLKANPNYYNSFWIEREKYIKVIQEKLEYNTKHLLTCHGFQVFNVNVLQEMKRQYMIPNKLTYLDFMKISPYEFSWYNIWLQKSATIPIHICEPWFKYYHMAYQQFAEVITNVDEESLGRAYVDVTICSFERDCRIISVADIDKIYYPMQIDIILKIFYIIFINYPRKVFKMIKNRRIIRKIIIKIKNRNQIN